MSSSIYKKPVFFLIVHSTIYSYTDRRVLVLQVDLWHALPSVWICVNWGTGLPVFEVKDLLTEEDWSPCTRKNHGEGSKTCQCLVRCSGFGGVGLGLIKPRDHNTRLPPRTYITYKIKNASKKKFPLTPWSPRSLALVCSVSLCRPWMSGRWGLGGFQ